MSFEENLKKYAKLLIRKGANVQEGEEVNLSIAVEHCEFAHLLVEECYAAGASRVVTNYYDDYSAHAFLEFGSADEHAKPGPTLAATDEWIGEKRPCRISITGGDPNAFADIDPSVFAVTSKAASPLVANARELTSTNKLSWLVASAADAGWAKAVFPDLTSEEGVAALWDLIFKITRVDLPDPIAAWDEHIATLKRRREYMNEQQFDRVHYWNEEGSDFVIGLPKNQSWASPGSITPGGRINLHNIPSEEIFCAPDRTRMDGVVVSTKPLVENGTVIENLRFTFADGVVTDVTADTGVEIVRELIATDEGSAHLGEFALVPHSTPISQSGVLFYMTLFDENASNHLALGSAYAHNVVGGTEMTPDERLAVGINTSAIHVDFMVGSATTNIDGIAADGSVTPLFRNGEWV
ncbi:MAG: aminopeptidase [Lactobacillales bacterium]|jgi:aminopeptidase|nr:aminopeptidase [Lactobacillales bacterium]